MNITAKTSLNGFRDRLYKPSSQSTSINLEDDVSIQGGFIGLNNQNIDPNTRNPAVYVTTITGDQWNNDHPDDPFNPNFISDNSYHVVKAIGGVTPPGSAPYIGEAEANLDGFTIRGGNAGGTGSGGGIYVNNSSPVIRNCIITACQSILYGGGIFANSGSDITLRDCQVVNNRSDEGGGIYIFGPATILSTTIKQNAATYSGGAFCFAVDGTHIRFINSTIFDNTTDLDGAGVSIGGSNTPSSRISFINCIISQNLTGEFASGGGIYLGNASLTLDGCTIAHNYARSHGGGLYWLSYGSASAPVLRNSIFWENFSTTGPEFYASTGGHKVLYCLLGPGTTGEPAGETVGVIDSHSPNNNPEFYDEDARDYRLTCASACINTGHPDAGNAASSGGFPEDTFDVDEDGNTSEKIVDRIFGPRILGPTSLLRIDMGAIEAHGHDGCATDVTGNGTVNMADLLAIIAAWGTGPSAMDVDPPCVGDGTVGINDLLAAIVEWGTCGNPSGMPESIEDCFNVYCAGLSGVEWESCLNRCSEAVCAANPEECE